MPQHTPTEAQFGQQARQAVAPSSPILPLIGIGSTLLGGILGSQGQRQPIDPNMLKQLFGPNALAGETQDLFRLLMNSPLGAQLFGQAGLQGQQVANQTRSNLAARGLSGTPIGAFQGAISQQLPGQFQRQAQGQLFNQALQTALQGLQSRQNLFGQSLLQQQATPSFGSQLGGAFLAGGAQAFGNIR